MNDDFAPGTKVTIDHPRAHGVYTVVRKMAVNYKVADANGAQITCAPSLMLRVIDDSNPSLIQTEAPKLVATFCPGEVVALKGQSGPYVVLKATPRGYSVAKLGGEGGRYWNVSAGLLTRMTLGTALEQGVNA